MIFAEERERQRVSGAHQKGRGDAKSGSRCSTTWRTIGELLKDADGNQLYLLTNGKVSATSRPMEAEAQRQTETDIASQRRILTLA